jgi:hypothetical protein
MGEVIMNPFSKKKKHTTEKEPVQYKRSDCKIILSGASFSAVPVKYEHSLYINPTLPY